MSGSWTTQTQETAVLRIFNNIYLYIFSRSVHSVLACFFFLHKQKNSYNSRLSKINTIKIELQNKYSIQREPSVVTFVVGWEGTTVKRGKWRNVMGTWNSFSVCNTKPNCGAVRRESKIRHHSYPQWKMAAQELSSTVTVSRGHENAYRRHEPEGRWSSWDALVNWIVQCKVMLPTAHQTSLGQHGVNTKLRGDGFRVLVQPTFSMLCNLGQVIV